MNLYNHLDLRIRELEEIQKQSDLPRSIRKENDRVLKELRTIRRGNKK